MLRVCEASANIFKRLESVGQVAIRKVVDKAAELIEASGAVGQCRAEKQACPVKRLAVSGENLFGLRTVHELPPGAYLDTG